MVVVVVTVDHDLKAEDIGAAAVMVLILCRLVSGRMAVNQEIMKAEPIPAMAFGVAAYWLAFNAHPGV